MGTQGDYVPIKSKAEIELRLPFILKRIESWDFTIPLVVKLEKYEDPRTISQNALSHKWYKEIAIAMTKKGIKVDYGKPEEVWKMFLKKRFLGVSSYTLGTKVIPDQVKGTSKLTKGEMVHFLDNVYHWAKDNGVLLIVPEDSEYQRMKQKQDR